MTAEEIIALLLEMKEYIEQCEVAFDFEMGEVRDLPELIADGKMPEIYEKVLDAIWKVT